MNMLIGKSINPLRWLQIEWARTGPVAKTILVAWFLVGMGLFGWLSRKSLTSADYGIVILAACVLLGRLLIPFILASAARKRGGSFGGWLAFGMICGYVIPTICYINDYKHKEILPEYAPQAESSLSTL